MGSPKKESLQVIPEVDESKYYVYDPITGNKVEKNAKEEDDEFAKI